MLHSKKHSLPNCNTATMDPDKVYIVVLNYNAWEDTIECVQSLCRQSYPLYEIIVVDNQSANDSRLQLLRWAKEQSDACFLPGFNVLDYTNGRFVPVQVQEHTHLTFIWSDKNGGFAYGNNIGIRYSFVQSKRHFIWLLNNDTVVLNDTLKTMVDFFEQHNRSGKVGLAGCLQRYYHNPNMVQTMFGRYNAWLGLPREYGAGLPVEEAKQLPQNNIDYLSGACLLTHSSVVEEVGMLSEDYFLFFEELDFARRLKLAGYGLLFCSNTSILHKHGMSINGGTKDGATPFGDYHHFRSEYIFARKFYKPYIPLYLLVAGMQLANRLLKGRFKNMRSLVSGVKAGLSYPLS
jgi:GT2 family glycosyltransferase